MHKSLRRWVLAVLAVLGAGAFVAGLYLVAVGPPALRTATGDSGGAVGGVIGTTGQARIGGPFSLVTSDGGPFSEAALAGAPTVIVFGLLDRDGLAPPAFNAIKTSVDEIGPAAGRVRILFVALDGRPDDLDALKEFARSHPSVAITATGEAAALTEIARSFKFYFRRDHEPGQSPSVSYAPFLFIMNAKGQYTSHARLPTNAGTLKPLIQAAL